MKAVSNTRIESDCAASDRAVRSTFRSAFTRGKTRFRHSRLLDPSATRCTPPRRS
jgi:hypothetical protein